MLSSRGSSPACLHAGKRPGALSGRCLCARWGGARICFFLVSSVAPHRLSRVARDHFYGWVLAYANHPVARPSVLPGSSFRARRGRRICAHVPAGGRGIPPLPFAPNIVILGEQRERRISPGFPGAPAVVSTGGSFSEGLSKLGPTGFPYLQLPLTCQSDASRRRIK